MWCITLIGLCTLKNPCCIPGINPTWSGYMILLICCWIQFASILLRIFAPMFMWYWPVIFFSLCVCDIFVWFGYQSDDSFVEWAWECSSAIFCKSFGRVGVNSFLNVWQNSPVRPSGSRHLFVGIFFFPLWGRFIFFKHNFLFIFGCTGSSLWHRLFSGCREQGLLFVVMWGLLIAVAPLVEHRLQVCGARQWRHTGLAAPWHVGASWTRDQTCAPYLSRWIFNQGSPCPAF